MFFKNIAAVCLKRMPALRRALHKPPPDRVGLKLNQSLKITDGGQYFLTKSGGFRTINTSSLIDKYLR
jgi:hypothetical protein